MRQPLVIILHVQNLRSGNFSDVRKAVGASPLLDSQRENREEETGEEGEEEDDNEDFHERKPL